MNCRLKLKKLQKGRKVRRWNLDKMKDPEVLEVFRGSIRQRLTETEGSKTVEEEWVALRDDIVKATEDQIGRKPRLSKSSWVTQEILNLIEERRKYKTAANELGKREYR